jgi:hypothetical protein
LQPLGIAQLFGEPRKFPCIEAAADHANFCGQGFSGYSRTLKRDCVNGIFTTSQSTSWSTEYEHTDRRNVCELHLERSIWSVRLISKSCTVYENAF